MKKMKHLIIGLGSVGKCHALNLLEHGQEIVGVDINPRKDSRFPIYDNIESGWNTNPDMVWVCTPTNLHTNMAIQALKRGLHVFVEKPLACDVGSAMYIQKVWEEMIEKRMVWVGCNMRFHQGVVRLKTAIDDGLIGRPHVYRFHFSHYLPNMRPGTDYRETYAAHSVQGGGIVLDDIHDIDLAMWFCGPVKKVNGVIAYSGTLEMDAEDIAHIFLSHYSGVYSEIHMDFLRRDKSRGIEVIGEKGTLEWRSLGKKPEQVILNWYQPGKKEVHRIWQNEIMDSKEMFAEQLNMVLETLNKHENYSIRLDEAIEALRIVQEVKENDACFA